MTFGISKIGGAVKLLSSIRVISSKFLASNVLFLIKLKFAVDPFKTNKNPIFNPNPIFQFQHHPKILLFSDKFKKKLLYL